MALDNCNVRLRKDEFFDFGLKTWASRMAQETFGQISIYIILAYHSCEFMFCIPSFIYSK